MVGSSPLTRGKRPTAMTITDDLRLIPAHAGKTTEADEDSRALWAHPRSRGENIRLPILRPGGMGSSPLTRGKPATYQVTAKLGGLIPAHAGKTDPHRAYRPHDGAHPRSRGENTPPLTPPVNRLGSSPLTRGKHQTDRVRVHSGGLIPAHAGKTGVVSFGWESKWAHPRSRGENSWRSRQSTHWGGSSPLTRGKRAGMYRRSGSRGLIPAHAGKTNFVGGHEAPEGAHPRSRGENARHPDPSGFRAGSSPLTRGKRSGLGCGADRSGLIPAHAGKTFLATFRAFFLWAHPRSRGENVSAASESTVCVGSSPLTRGKRSARAGLRSWRRLIPAHAGKT